MKNEENVVQVKSYEFAIRIVRVYNLIPHSSLCIVHCAQNGCAALHVVIELDG